MGSSSTPAGRTPLMAAQRRARATLALSALAATLAVFPASAAPAAPPGDRSATVTAAAAADTSAPLTELAKRASRQPARVTVPRDERGPTVRDTGHTRDGALQDTPAGPRIAAVSAPVVSFEGIANSANPILVSPPDPVGDV